jgi:hypothetical protein
MHSGCHGYTAMTRFVELGSDTSSTPDIMFIPLLLDLLSRTADHSPPFSGELRVRGGIIPLPNMSHGMIPGEAQE